MRVIQNKTKQKDKNLFVMMINPGFSQNKGCRRHKVGTLTAHNWQNWKSVFLSCHCHEIYMVEAVSQKNSNNT